MLSESDPSALGIELHAREHRDEGDEVARRRRQVEDFLRRDVAADLRARQVHLRHLRGDGDRLLQAADLELDLDRQRVAEGRASISSCVELLEAGEVGGDTVAAGQDAGHEHVPSAPVDRLAERAAVHVGDHDADAGKHASLVIDDSSLHGRPANLLGVSGGGDEQHPEHHENPMRCICALLLETPINSSVGSIIVTASDWRPSAPRRRRRPPGSESSRRGELGGGRPRSSSIRRADVGAEPHGHRLLVREAGRGQVLGRHPDGLEQRDLDDRRAARPCAPVMTSPISA